VRKRGKENEFRALAIPTVRDRVAAGAAHSVLEHRFEPLFHDRLEGWATGARMSLPASLRSPGRGGGWWWWPMTWWTIAGVTAWRTCCWTVACACSVFECVLARAELRELVRRLHGLIDAAEDGVAFYPVCRRCRTRVAPSAARRRTRTRSTASCDQTVRYETSEGGPETPVVFQLRLSPPLT
jgi:hypothetical protein